MSSSVLHNLGRLHIFTAVITVNSSNVWQVASHNQDVAPTVSDATGNTTITFGEAFLSAPVCVISPIKATHSATAHHAVTLEAVTSTTAEVRYLATSTEAVAGSSPDPATDDGFHIIAIGLRNN